MTTDQAPELPQEEQQIQQLDEKLDPNTAGDLGEMGPQMSEKTPSEEPKDDSPQEPEEPAFSLDERTTAIAEDMGLDVEQLGAETVQSLVDHSEKLAFEQFRQLQQQVQDPQQQAPPERNERGQFVPQQQPPPQQFQQAPEMNQPELPGPLELNLSPDDYGEEIIQAFSGINEHLSKVTDYYKTQLDSLNAIVQSQVEEAENTRHREITSWFDKSLSGLGDAAFGNGSLEDLNPASQEYMQRVKLFDTYQEMFQFRFPNDNVRQDDELLRQVLRWQGLSSEPSKKQKQLSDSVRKRSRQTIGRPSGRKRNGPASDEVDPQSGHSVNMVENMQRRIAEMTG